MRLAPKLYCARWLVIQSNVLIAVSAIHQSVYIVIVVGSDVSTLISLHMGISNNPRI